MAKNDVDGLVLMLDVGESMSTRNGNSTYLQSCADIIQMIVQRKMFQSSKDEVALILFGTRDTANVLNMKDPNQYQHINVARPLSLVDWKLLEFIQNDLLVSNITGDVIDALIVASNHFVEDNNKNKVFKDKRIIFFTDFSSTAEDSNDLESILHNLRKHDIRIDVISPFSESDDDTDSKQNVKHDNVDNDATTSKQNGHNHSNTQTKGMTKHQKEIQNILRKTCTETDGSLYSFSEALKVLSVYQAKSIRSAGTKYTMTIGESLKLPIISLIKCKENKPDIFRFKKVYAKDEKIELKTDRTRFTKDDEKRNLDDKDDVIDAYRYGSTNVPIDDPESVRLKCEKCFSLLGFSKSEKVKRHYYLSDSVNQIMPDGAAGPDVEEAFVSMVRAMYLEGVYGLVRRVFSSRSSPELGCLIPHISVDNACLYYVALPFDDDVRKFKLENFKPKFKPNESQLNLIDQLIDGMDLTPDNKSDDEDDEEELFDPHTTFNPYIQRMFQSIALRATQPDADIPNFDRNLTSIHSSELEQRIKNNKVVDLLKRCADEFPTKVLSKKVKKDESLFVDKTKEMNNGDKSDVANNDNIGLDEMLNSDDAKLAKVKQIGTITPVDDFKILAERIKNENKEDFEDLCVQIQALIKDFLNESLNQDDNELGSNKLQAKAVDCIRIQRDYCIRLNTVDTYNTYLKAFKIYLINLQSNKKYSKQLKSFWMKHFSNLSLISTLECSSSDVSQQEAKQFVDVFVNNDATQVETKKEEESENVEDLLDMM